jgi:predicted enzyme related to lactoylglutathione lyase
MTDVTFSALTFLSKDPARLAEFYRRELGLPLASTTHGTVPEHFEGLLSGVHIAVLPARPGLGGPIVPVFRVESAEAATADMRARGVEVLMKPLDIGEGKRVAAFADIDGNAFRLIEIGPM